MPAIDAGRVLVTGANGYIAFWIVKALLNRGFAVRGTVRAESKAVHLRSVFESYGDKFEVAIVDDMIKEGAFDEAVKGVDAVAHTASPVHFTAVEPSEIIDPAVAGITGILTSVLRHGSSVKRVVVTSSTAAIVSPTPAPHTFTEADWNEACITEVTTKGKLASGIDKYRASKVFAERSAWEFWRTRQSEVGWDLVVLNPPFVYGPCLHEVDKPENLNSSAKMWYDHVVVLGGLDDHTAAKAGSCFVDVRDLANAHVLAITKPEASGERFIISQGPFRWAEFVLAARNFLPDLPLRDQTYDPANPTYHAHFSNDKARARLGMTFLTMEETTKDILDEYRGKGWR